MQAPTPAAKVTRRKSTTRKPRATKGNVAPETDDQADGETTVAENVCDLEPDKADAS